MAFRPSRSWTVAPTGQTSSHGAFSQCMHGTAWKATWGAAGSPEKYRSTRIQCISRPCETCSLPTTGTLFSDWQAVTQALQPMQAPRSIDMPHWWPAL